MLAQLLTAVLKRVAIAAAILCMPVIVFGEDGQLTNPYARQAEVIEEAGSLFNQYCSHCHGPYAIQGERARDLRRLHLRYGDSMISTYYTTVQDGRMQKGMPYWKGILDDDVVWKIYTFLQTVQIED